MIAGRDDRDNPRRATGKHPRRDALLLLGLAAGLLVGCQASLPASAGHAAVPTDTNAELCEYIADLPYLTAEAGYRALYILWRGEVHAEDYESLKDELRGGGLLVADVEPNRFLDKGQIARAVARVCEIKTGVNWLLTGLGRYAWRELQYERIARTTGEYGYVSGGEFLGILARAEEYLHKTGRGPAARAELGEQPND